MARMDSVKASNVKVSGDLAKNKLARKLNNKPDSATFNTQTITVKPTRGNQTMHTHVVDLLTDCNTVHYGADSHTS